MLDKFIIREDVETSPVMLAIFIVWAIVYILQAFLAFGTAYRCTKCGNDNGVGLFIYLIGFGFAALVPGLGLHYYIKYLPPKIIIQQQPQPQPQIIRVVQPPQQQSPDVTVQAEMQQSRYNNTQNPYAEQQGQTSNQQNLFAEQRYNQQYNNHQDNQK